MITDWQLASKYTDDSALTTFLNGYEGTLTTIRGQIDQKAQTWYQSTDPSAAWTTATLKAEHEGDLWYCTAEIKDGSTVLFEQNATYRWNGTAWEQQDAPKAVFDAIDGKRQIFTSQPEDADEYEEGDLWVNATYGTTYSNDLLRCKAGKAKNAAFSISHWELASKYTDDTAVDELVVGGTNLLPDSNVPSLAKVYGTVARYISDSGNSSYVTGESIEVTDAPVAGIKYGFRFICSNASTTATQRGYRRYYTSVTGNTGQWQYLHNIPVETPMYKRNVGY